MTIAASTQGTILWTDCAVYCRIVRLPGLLAPIRFKVLEISLWPDIHLGVVAAHGILYRHARWGHKMCRAAP
eukprot:6455758-Amphidinium_carterae.2